MDKQEILHQIKLLSSRDRISKEELHQAFYEGKHTTFSAAQLILNNYVVITALFFGITIFSMGLFVLLWQYWGLLQLPFKIVITGIAAIGAFSAGICTNPKPRLWLINGVCYLISAIFIVYFLDLLLHIIFKVPLIRTGLFGRVIDILFHYPNLMIFSIIAGFCLVLYGTTYFFFQKNILIFLSIASGTWLFFNLTNLLQDYIAQYYSETYPLSLFAEMDKGLYTFYRLLIVGVCFLGLAVIFRLLHKYRLSTIMYIAGTITTLGAVLTFTLPYYHALAWQIIFPFLIVLFLYISTLLQNLAILLITTAFSIAYILHITNRYFAKTFGWPIALILAGVIFVIIGYAIAQIKRRYI